MKVSAATANERRNVYGAGPAGSALMLMALVNRALFVELAQTRELNPQPAVAFKILCSEAVNGDTGSTKTHWPPAGPFVNGLGAGF